MRKHLLFLAGLLILLNPLPATEIFVVNSASRTLSRIDTASGETDNSFAQLGLTPNLMEVDEDHIYVVCSGDNAIQVIDRHSGVHIRYIPVAPSSNPYDVHKAGEFLYVSGLFTDKVYKISLQSNSVVGSLAVGTAPEGLASAQNRLFVCNTGGYSTNYAGSSVTVIDLATFSVVETIPVWTNPQFCLARNGFLHVSCTGNWTDVSGKVDIIDLDTLQRLQRLDLGGNPGNIWIGPGGQAYLGEGMGFGLYCYDADTYEICHGASNPLPYDAFAVSGNMNMLALLDQNWSGNSLVATYQSDFSPLAAYEVGFSSTDLYVAPAASPVPAELSPAAQIRIHPNPLPRLAPLRVATPGPGQGTLSLFNLRGQRLLSQKIGPRENLLEPIAFPAGIYLYKVEWNGVPSRGKLLILD